VIDQLGADAQRDRLAEAAALALSVAWPSDAALVYLGCVHDEVKRASSSMSRSCLMTPASLRVVAFA
jgi:hypothetical protein